MSELTGGERTLEEPFWRIDSVADAGVVDRVLRGLFPRTFQILESSLEEADPFEIVYPGNPHEYSDVVAEVLVLLAPQQGDLRGLSRAQITDVLSHGIARRFGEEPDKIRFQRLVELVFTAATAATE